jgi:hypothetical protein
MGNTEDAHHDIPSMLSKLSSSQTGRGMFMLHRVENETYEHQASVKSEGVGTIGLTDLASAAKAKVSPTVSAGK